VAVIARHRAEMFNDMGVLPPSLYGQLVEESERVLDAAIATGEYVGWLASPHEAEHQIVAGAGAQRRRRLPNPIAGRDGVTIARGHQAIVLNVFTEREWRRQGLAALLMAYVIDWARSAGIDSLVLHASEHGRPLYEALGFVPTNEMRFTGGL
jgi:GNAT superfamily N-acetyltransferase